MGKGIVHKIGARYLQKALKRMPDNGSQFKSFNPNQISSIKKISRETYFWSALIGIAAVLIVILPFQLFNSFFGVQQMEIFNYTFEFEVYHGIYAILMLFPEIWLLNYVNLRAVKKICLIANYPAKSQPDLKGQIEFLTDAGLEIPEKRLAEFNIDPFIGLSKFSYYSLFVLNKLKATLSNVIVRLLVKRLLGRYALRIITDLAGMPIFAFWNVWTSRTIIRETKMRIMATVASQEFIKEIDTNNFENMKQDIGRLFHFIAQQKRAYNFALFAFIKEVFTIVPNFELEKSREIKMSELFGEELDKNLLMARMLVFGLMIDGKLSRRERNTLSKLSEMDWFPYGMEFLENATKEYAQGRGVPQF